MNAEPVFTAKMSAETAIRNTVASVAAAFAPAMMFMLPMLRAMAFPGCLPDVLIVFVPLGIMHVVRPVPRLIMWLLVLRLVVICPLRFVGALLVLALAPICLVFVRGLCRRPPVLIFVLFIFMLLGIALPSVVVAVLCIGKSRCS